MHTHHLIIVATLIVNLIGCSGSSGGTGITTSPGANGQVLGSRGVPGGTVTVSSDGPLQPGVANLFHITFSSDMPVPSGIRAWIVSAYDPTAEGIQATPIATVPGSYDVTLTVPTVAVAENHVWVRLLFADGSVIETGSEDFLLAGQ